MRFLGIDLAWGEKARTGLAILDDDGRLARSASVISDTEIAEFINYESHMTRLIAAIDAPLIVRNDTGQRPGEREIGKHFSRYHASAHTSNLKRPHFQPEPRGMRLARRFGWSVDPADRTTGANCAIEVYPHPAMVSLFGLDRVIPYKGKRRRSVTERQEAFMRLFDLMGYHLEDPLVLSSYSRWSELKDQVRDAPRQVDLDRVEDEIDAIFCAYLAWLWGQDATDLVVFGDVEAGYIVTLPAPPGFTS